MAEAGRAGERLRIGELPLLGNAQICMPRPIGAKLSGTRFVERNY